MKTAPLPSDESQRLAELRGFQILDTPPEQAFDHITRFAAQSFGVPMALISLVDESRQWFKSSCGLDATETPREVAFCAHAILGTTPFVVPDALADERFSDNPLVLGPPYVRFYAGAPLMTGSGRCLGTLCLIDTRPHDPLDDKQLDLLSKLASAVMVEMELRQARQLAQKAVAATATATG